MVEVSLDVAYDAYLQASKYEEDYEPMSKQEFADRWGFDTGVTESVPPSTESVIPPPTEVTVPSPSEVTPLPPSEIPSPTVEPIVPTIVGGYDVSQYLPQEGQKLAPGVWGKQVTTFQNMVATNAPLAVQLAYLERYPMLKTIGRVQQLFGGIAEGIEEYSALEGKQQFEKAMELGFVPEGSEYVAPTDVMDTWGYITPEQVQARNQFEADLKETAPDLYEIYKREGQEAMLKAWEQELKIASPKLYEVYKREGYEGFLKAYDANKIYDYESGEWVRATPEQFEARQAFYGKYPILMSPTAFTPKQYVQRHSEVKSIPIKDINNLTLGEVENLIRGGVAPDILVMAGTDATLINTAVATVNKERQIPEKAQIVGITEEGQIQYIIPLNFEQLETEFLGESREDQLQIMASTIPEVHVFLEQGIITGTAEFKSKAIEKGFWEALSDKQKQEVLSLYSTLTGEKEFLGEVVGKGVEARLPYYKVVAAPVPIVGTIVNWEDMSPTWRVISVAADVFTFLSPVIVPASSRMLKAITSSLRGIDKADEAVRVSTTIANYSDEALEGLRASAPELGTSFRPVVKAMGQYADDLVEVEAINKAIEGTDYALNMTRNQIKTIQTGSRLHQFLLDYINESESALARYNSMLDDAVRASLPNKVALQEAAKEFGDDIINILRPTDPDALKSMLGVSRTDMPVALTTVDDVIKQFSGFPDDIARQVEATVKTAFKPPRSVAVIEEELALLKAQQNEIIAREMAKIGMPDPFKWTDISAEISKLETELFVAKLGTIEKLSGVVADIRTMVKEFESALSKATDPEWIRVLNENLRIARARLTKLEDMLANTLEWAKLEWQEGGVYAGRMPTRIRPPSVIPSGGGRQVIREVPLTIATLPYEVKPIPGVILPSPYPEITPRRRIIKVDPHLGITVEPEVIPETIPQVEPEREPEVFPIYPPTPPEVSPGIEIVPELKPYPGVTEIERRVEQTVAPMEETAAERQARIARQQKTATAEGVVTPIPSPSLIPAVMPTPIPAVVTEFATEPEIETVPEIVTAVAPKPALEAPPSEPPIVVTPPIIPPVRIPPAILPSEMPETWRRGGIPAGTITWRQGMKWCVLPPPYRDEDMMFLAHPLPGTYKFATGKGSAYKTLQVIGGAPTEDADVDMGWAQIHISSKDGKLSIAFGGGEEAAETRWAMEDEAMGQYDRESYYERPIEPIYETIPKVRKARIPKEVEGETIEEIEPAKPAYSDIELAELLALIEARKESKVPPNIKKRLGKLTVEEQSGIPDRYYLGRKLRPVSLGGNI